MFGNEGPSVLLGLAQLTAVGPARPNTERAFSLKGRVLRQMIVQYGPQDTTNSFLFCRLPLILIFVVRTLVKVKQNIITPLASHIILRFANDIVGRYPHPCIYFCFSYVWSIQSYKSRLQWQFLKKIFRSLNSKT